MPEGVSTEKLLVQPSEQAKNQAAVQESGTLQQEVHTLADSLVPEQKTSDTPAQNSFFRCVLRSDMVARRCTFEPN